MLLQLLSEGNRIKVFKTVNGFSETLVVLFLNKHLVEGLVDGFVVVGLHSAEVRFHKLEVTGTGEEADTTSVIQSGRQHNEEVVDQKRLVIQVERQRTVVQLNIGNLCDDLLEEALLPGLRGVGHHGEHGIVVLLVFVVEEDQL